MKMRTGRGPRSSREADSGTHTPAVKQSSLIFAVLANCTGVAAKPVPLRSCSVGLTWGQPNGVFVASKVAPSVANFGGANRLELDVEAP